MAVSCHFGFVCDSFLLIGYFGKREETPETYPCVSNENLTAMIERLELDTDPSSNRLLRLRLKRLACASPLNAPLTEGISSHPFDREVKYGHEDERYKNWAFCL